MAGNDKSRVDAKVSATTILRCPRQVVLSEDVDVWERPQDYYARYRGDAFHALAERAAERNPDQFAGVVQEERLYRDIEVLGKVMTVSGQPDWDDRDRNILKDTKSTGRIPKEPYQKHIEQLNVYAWLIEGNHGCVPSRAQLVYCDMSEEKIVDVDLWPIETTNGFILDKLGQIISSEQTGILPPVLPDFPSAFDCRYCPVKSTCVDHYQRGE